MHDDVLENVLTAIRAWRYIFSSEDCLQQGIAGALSDAGLQHDREVLLNEKDRIDFLVNGVGIEVKIDGTANALVRQLHRYAQHERISSLVVVTNRSRLARMPRELNGKPVLVVSLLDGVL